MESPYAREFTSLLNEGNYLGAWYWVKQKISAPEEIAAYAGEAGKAIMKALDQAVRDRNTEQEAWLRANLAYVLREFPGLSALYREQVRDSRSTPNLGETLGQGVKNTLKDLSDIAEGRVSLDEKLRDTLEKTSAQVKEQLNSGSILNSVSKGIEEGISALSGLFSSPAKPSGSPSASTAATPKAEAGEKPVKVKIENADDPLPHHIEKAEPGN